MQVEQVAWVLSVQGCAQFATEKHQQAVELAEIGAGNRTVSPALAARLKRPIPGSPEALAAAKPIKARNADLLSNAPPRKQGSRRKRKRGS